VRLALTDLDAKGGRELCGEIKESGLKNDMVFAALDCTGTLSLLERGRRGREGRLILCQGE